LWLSASYIDAGSHTDGDAIASWTDRSGNFGSNMTQATVANRPILKNNATDNLNYNPVVSFNEDDANYRSMNLGSNYLFVSSPDSGFSAYVVVIPGDDSSPIDNQLLLDFGEYPAKGYGLMYSDINMTAYTPGLASIRVKHNRSRKPTMMGLRSNWGPTIKKQFIIIDGGTLIEENPAATSEISAATVNANGTATATSGPITIGKNSTTSAANEFDGKIAEIIILPQSISYQERLSTETYLALKYGISKTSDYLDDNLNMIYNYGNQYTYDIIGLAREDNNHLNQTISTSTNKPGEFVISMNETGAVSTDDISTAINNNTSYLIVGHNGSNLANGRIYKVTATNFNQQITMQLHYPKGFSAVPSLFVDDNDTFSSPSEITAGVLSDGNTKVTYHYTFSNNTTEYFYIDIPCPPSPGGVCNNLELWLNSESISQADNTEVTLWKDNSTSGFDAINDSLTGPRFQNEASELINFHPVVEFDGTTNGLNLAEKYLYSKGNGGISIFSVVQPDSSANKTKPFIFDFGGYQQGYGFGYGYENIFGYTSNEVGGSDFQDIHTKKNKPAIVSSHIVFNSNHELMIDGEIFHDDENTNISQLSTVEVPAMPYHELAGGPVSIGRLSKYFYIDMNNGRRFGGKMTELIFYNADLSDAETEKIDTYLAIKYGISLSKNYVNSAGAVIWDRSANEAYSFDIAGIMRDDNSMLDQRQSKAVSDNAILTIGKGSITTSNAANPNTFTADLDCVIWGSNGGATIATGTAEKPAVYDRLGREWLISEPYNNTGTLRIQFDLSNAGTIADVNHLRLLVDNDGDFSDAAIAAATFTQSGNQYYVDYNLNNGQYFTIATTNALSPLKPFTSTEPGIGINTGSVDPSAAVHIAASSGAAGNRYKGVLTPRMGNSAMLNIVAPPTGLIVFNTTHERFMYNAGTPNLPKWMFIGGVLVQTSRQLETQPGYYKGEMRYNDSTDTIWYWDGSDWIEIDNF